MLYKKIDASSGEVVSSALAIFETPPSNVGVASSVYQEVLPSNPITEPPYRFRINTGACLLDLSNVYLAVDLRIMKENEDHQMVPITSADKVGTINVIGLSWIRTLRVSLNTKETFHSNSLTPYKEYFDSHLSFSPSVKANYLQTIGYAPSNATQYDQNLATDAGYLQRKGWFSEGKVAHFYSRLTSDIFSSQLYLLNHCLLDLEFHPHESDFTLLKLEDVASKTNYKLEVVGARIYARMVELMDGINLSIERMLSVSPAKYPIKKVELKNIFISAGRTELQTTLFSEQIPRRVLAALVDADAFNGVKGKSPFQFNPNGVRDISISAGVSTFPSIHYDLDFDSGNFLRAYHDSMDGLGMAGTLEGNGISPSHFKQGTCVFVFTLTADGENSPAFELLKTGTSSIYIKFHNALEHSLMLVIYAEMDALLFVDTNRSLTSDAIV